MFCHYQILGVELNADQETIKKAYRKAALKWHPDKNPDNLEEATEQFRLVQAAYDVLSDPQEKAWYDRHREEILHRKQFENYKNDSIDLFDYFTPSAYKGFGDDGKGFYAIYREVFAKISSEDKPFCSTDSEDDEMPTFGDSTSDYEEIVHNFYATWQSYTTRMSFVWVSQYDVKEATNRRVARIIEKENKKERDKHRKKRNELVRELVTFVRKRDPRIKAHKLELERLAEEQALKAEERRVSLIRERVREAALYEETNREERMRENERIAQLENMMKDEFGFLSENESNSQDGSSEYEDDLFCIACNKLFKSEMGMKNHQKSKKHKEKMNRLREEMRDEEVTEETQADDGAGEIEIIEETKDEVVTSTRKTKRQKKKNKIQKQNLQSNMTSLEKDDIDNEGISLQANVSNATRDEEASKTDGQHPSNMPELVSKPAKQKNLETVTNGRMHNKKKKKKSEKNFCQTCKNDFESRNKLFQHLKETGHSVLTDRK